MRARFVCSPAAEHAPTGFEFSEFSANPADSARLQPFQRNSSRFEGGGGF
ncbi:hypothetical protein ACFPRL_13380 [Pseudoclavibacter helvolus]